MEPTELLDHDYWGWGGKRGGRNRGIDKMHQKDLTTEGGRCGGGLSTLENSLVKAEEEKSSNNKRFFIRHWQVFEV